MTIAAINPKVSAVETQHASATSMPAHLQTLAIQFPDERVWPGWDIPEVMLSLVPDSNTFALPSNCRVVIDPKHQTDYYSDSPVFCGMVQPSGSGGHNTKAQFQTPSGVVSPMQVAVKFAMREDLVTDLLHEAEAYAGPLAPIQGKSVPRCFGLYAGVREDDGRTLACLVVEWFGEIVKRPFGKLGVDLRSRILKSLMDIHAQGLAHNDFAERNVLVAKSGEVKIIDFDMTEPCHGCLRMGHWSGGGKGRFFERLDTATETVCEEDFGCEELWRAWKQDLKLAGHQRL